MIKMLYCKSCAILLCIIFNFYNATSLELTEFVVPSHVPLGVRAVLLCNWKLNQNDVVYSVKWYKDGKEFFRHVPKDNEPLRKFSLPGVEVEKFNPSGSSLTLAPATLATSGRYRCEVSGERPQFQTVSKYDDILAMVLPTQGLNIDGFMSRYNVGEYVRATCSLSQFKPDVGIAWYINGKPASSTMLSEPVNVEENGENISLGIRFLVQENLVGNLKLQCVATIASMYWRSIDKTALVFETREYTEDIRTVQDNIAYAYPRNDTSGVEKIKQQYIPIALVYIFWCYIYIYYSK